MKIFNLTNILFIGLLLLFTICINASYNIYLDKNAKNIYYIIDAKKYEVFRFHDLYKYTKREISKEDYDKFIKNLDRNSKKEVAFIMDSSVLVLNAVDLGYNVVRPFSNRQAKEIKKFYKFIDSKKDIDASTIQYGKYKFPIFEGEVQTLYNKYGMDKVKHKKKLEKKAIIDAGAYIGDSSVVLAEYTKDKVYAFEPIDENYNKLLKTIKLNNMENKIIPEKLSIGDNNNPKVMYSYLDHMYTANSKYGKVKYFVKSTTIDDFVKENNIKVGVIKSDIEGDEMNLLKGAKQTILKQKPVLLISIYHSGKDFFEIKKWIEDLDKGYKFQIFRSKPDDILVGTILIAQ